MLPGTVSVIFKQGYCFIGLHITNINNGPFSMTFNNSPGFTLVLK